MQKYIGRSSYKSTTTQIPPGYPAKWLIFSGVMFYATFWSGNFFTIPFTHNYIINDWTKRLLSTYSISHDPRCTWRLLYDYNYEHWDNFSGSIDEIQNLSHNLPHKIPRIPKNYLSEFHDCLDETKEPVLYFFGTMDSVKQELYFNFFEPTTYVLNDIPNQYQSREIKSYTAPAVSIEARLELLKTQYMEVNLALQTSIR